MSADQLHHVERRFNAADTGKEIRKALKAAFPGVKFSLRGSRGTGYGWFTLSWTDGPTTSAADAVCNGFRSSYFDGMDDSTHQIPATLYAMDDGTLYTPHWCCHGVNTERSYSPEADAWARSYADAHGGPETFTPNYPGGGYPASTWRILAGVDLVGINWADVPLVTAGYAGRHVPSSYCVETGGTYYGETAPRHALKVTR